MRRIRTESIAFDYGSTQSEAESWRGYGLIRGTLNVTPKPAWMDPARALLQVEPKHYQTV